MVSLMSVISTISIALGVAVLIIGLSAMSGFERELNDRILDVVPHGTIEPMNPPFSDWSALLKRIEAVPGILVVAPYLNFTGLAEHDEKLQAIQIKGVDPALEMRLSALPRYVQGDAWSHFQSGRQHVILGQGVADRLQVQSGDWITVMIPNTDPQMKLLQPKSILLQVCGIIALNGQLDYSFAMVPLADAQNYLQHGEDIGGIAIKVSDVFNANKLVRNAGEAASAYVKIHSWIDTYGYMYRDIQIIRVMIYLAMALVISIAYFNIVSAMVLAVKDKSADIAILRTLGAQGGLTYAIFIWYALLAGLTGSVIGVVTGVLIALNLTTLVKGLEELLGYQMLSGEMYFIDFLPTELHWSDVVSVLIIALALSLLASGYPARRAGRIDPARILSGH
ncbi:lipoprotein releasing system, transmembrane protein LolE [secondary endosymbiont of Ctenarytaina eucalypti]|uniref:Lipoprotein releasing system, transmembrane protein LolE n=2 Tax=secondary endosymbiont of Ctenarytaina eucalypti TaxID=1199245 RepID=J3TXU4_9ENTR|nr:lipoprotein releasing system, transmembrane protein LolE [secondary endosymbiont of Ctenarytaina eucalypti]